MKTKRTPSKTFVFWSVALWQQNVVNKFLKIVEKSIVCGEKCFRWWRLTANLLSLFLGEKSCRLALILGSQVISATFCLPQKRYPPSAFWLRKLLIFSTETKTQFSKKMKVQRKKGEGRNSFAMPRKSIVKWLSERRKPPMYAIRRGVASSVSKDTSRLRVLLAGL